MWFFGLFINYMKKTIKPSRPGLVQSDVYYGTVLHWSRPASHDPIKSKKLLSITSVFWAFILVSFSEIQKHIIFIFITTDNNDNIKLAIQNAWPQVSEIKLIYYIILPDASTIFPNQAHVECTWFILLVLQSHITLSLAVA